MLYGHTGRRNTYSTSPQGSLSLSLSRMVLYRIRIRPPCCTTYSTLQQQVRGKSRNTCLRDTAKFICLSCRSRTYSLRWFVFLQRIDLSPCRLIWHARWEEQTAFGRRRICDMYTCETKAVLELHRIRLAPSDSLDRTGPWIQST
jgi:hypothetical protein